MTREQIEQAAVAIKESHNYHMSFEDAQDYISKCGFDIPWNDGDVFVDDREITRTIGNVLKWRINSVWHGTNKKPRTDEDLLLWLDSHDMVVPGTYNEYEDMYVLTTGYVLRDYNVGKWAYIGDLLPERKEETK